MQLDENEKRRYLGEAHFLRAYFYWNLVRCFGGVPKINKILASQADIEEASKRVSAEEIYRLIETDLESALNSLPNQISKSRTRETYQVFSHGIFS
ncbi:MAG: RagB/SusD family nutrient uptake outer membrane protein [Saprospiraceae bacterium]|nr:RagB/SusD family nutrient uptake outer membrane protein [Candidatus Vicinibacter affinis]